MKQKQREIENRADAFMSIYGEELKICPTKTVYEGNGKKSPTIYARVIPFNPLCPDYNKKLIRQLVSDVIGIPDEALSQEIEPSMVDMLQIFDDEW